VLDPRMPLDPQLIRYRTQLRDPVAQVLLGNSVTLTPGTVTAEISTSELVVHALDGHSASDLVSQRLERKVGEVFSRKGSS
jgi:multicomponent Na+:H+ antiporter subunit E